MSGHYCKRATTQGDWMDYPMTCLGQQCAECAAWEEIALRTPYRATLKFNDEVRVIEGDMQTEPLKTAKPKGLSVAHRRVITCAKEVVKLWLLLDTRFPLKKGEFVVEMTRLRNAIDRLKR